MPPHRNLARIALLLTFLTTLCLPGLAQENEVCLDCHDDEEFTSERKGREVSMHVEPGRYGKSVHGETDCIECHSDLEDMEDEHSETLEKVNCGECHEEVQEIFGKSLHGKLIAEGDELAASCADCHGSHYILPADDPKAVFSRMNVPLMCGRCHREGSPVEKRDH
ncbi:MAG: cytochrome c3 family protein, partial [Planctomycetota bacterium]